MEFYVDFYTNTMKERKKEKERYKKLNSALFLLAVYRCENTVRIIFVQSFNMPPYFIIIYFKGAGVGNEVWVLS